LDRGEVLLPRMRLSITYLLLPTIFHEIEA